MSAATTNWVVGAMRAIGQSALDCHPSPIVDEDRMSLPRICVQDGRQAVTVLFSRARPGRPARPPHAVAHVSYPGTEVAWSTPTWDEKTLSAQAPWPATQLEPSEWDPSTHMALEDRYFELLSTVLEKGWLVGHSHGAADERRVAEEITRIERAIIEPDLEPCYRVYDKAFRDWLARLS